MYNSQDLAFQEALFQLEQLEELVRSSEELNSTEINTNQRNYSEPFGIDTMQPEQWFLHVYYPVAKQHLIDKNVELFANDLNLAYVFEHFYRNNKTSVHDAFIQKCQLFELALSKLSSSRNTVVSNNLPTINTSN